MKIYELKDYYLKFVEQETTSFEEDFRKDVYRITEAFLDSVINYEDITALKEIDYSMVKKLVESENNKSINYTLHLIALEPYDIIEWISYIDSDDFFEPERHYFENEELAEILKNKDYYNPLTGEDVSQEEFKKLINTVFSVSENFITRYKIYTSCGDLSNE